MRNWSHISDHIDPDAQSSQRANRRFASRAGALDFDIQILDPLLNGSTASNLRSNLSCKRC